MNLNLLLWHYVNLKVEFINTFDIESFSDSEQTLDFVFILEKNSSTR